MQYFSNLCDANFTPFLHFHAIQAFFVLNRYFLFKTTLSRYLQFGEKKGKIFLYLFLAKNFLLKDMKTTLNVFSKPSQQHFEELKAKQKQEQCKFQERLMQEIAFEEAQNAHNREHERKFYNVDQMQNVPVPIHTYDPVHHSPIPKKRHESYETPMTSVAPVAPVVPVAPLTPTLPRRSSLDHQLREPLFMPERTRSNSLPRRNNYTGPFMAKSDFWTNSLPRNKRKVKFDDEPPVRPPPPAPIRDQSLGYMPNEYRESSLLRDQSLGYIQSEPYEGSVSRDQSVTYRPSEPMENNPIGPIRDQSQVYVKPDPMPRAPVRSQSLSYIKSRPNQNQSDHDHENGDEYMKAHFGLKKPYKDPWVEKYGKAVLNNTLQKRIEAKKLISMFGSVEAYQQAMLEYEQEQARRLICQLTLK